LRLGIIGLGRAAALLTPSLAAHPKVRLTAAADPNPVARDRFAAEFAGAVFSGAEELCARGRRYRLHRVSARRSCLSRAHGPLRTIVNLERWQRFSRFLAVPSRS
jgi:hypothetical protein